MKRIYESGRWLSAIDVEYVGISVAGAALDRVVEWEATVDVEVTPLVEADRIDVCREDVEINGFAFLVFP